MLSETEKQEIRTMYRQAADKGRQIGILADLYDTSKKEIQTIIGKAAREEIRKPCKPKKRLTPVHRQPARKYTPTQKKEVVAWMLHGKHTGKEAAEHFKIPEGTVNSWKYDERSY